MLGFSSPETMRVMKRPMLISFVLVLLFTALMISAYAFNIIAPEKALRAGIVLLFLNTAQLTPAVLKARKLEYAHKAALMDTKYTAECEGDS